MYKQLNLLALFYEVCEAKSFTNAARRLNCSKAYLSKQVAQLEREVGSKLLNRNSRNVEMTYAGELLLAEARQLIQQYKQVENQIAAMQEKAVGKLKVTAPPAYLHYVLSEKMIDFMQAFPEINIDLFVTSDLVDFTAEKIDVAIRITQDPPENKIAKKIGETKIITAASSEYLERNQKIQKPQELLKQAVLVHSTKHINHKWSYRIKNKLEYIEVTPKFTSNHVGFLINSASNHLGIVSLPDFILADSIECGKLTPILEDFAPPSIPIYAIYDQGRIIPPRIRAFVDFVQTS